MTAMISAEIRHSAFKESRHQQGNVNVNCLAKALYDNVAEAPDELAFRKSDILTVLEQNTNGLEGWWLCSLRGRQGIAPGNRLRLLPGMYDPTGLGNAGGVSSPFSGSGNVTEQNNRHSKRRSWHTNPNKVITPQKIGDVYLYDIPLNSRIPEPYDVPHPSLQHKLGHSTVISAQGSYDTPPSPRALRIQEAYDEPRSHSVPIDACKQMTYDEPQNAPISAYDAPKAYNYDVPPSACLGGAYDIPAPARVVEIKDTTAYDIPSLNNTVISEAYDIPRSHSQNAGVTYDVPPSKRSSGVSVMSTSSSSVLSPSSSQSSLNMSLSLSSLCGSNRSSLEQQTHELYDIPPSGPQRPVDSHLLQNSHLPKSGLCDLYNVPSNNVAISSISQFYDTPPTPRPAKPPINEGVYDVPPQVTRDVGSLSKCDEVDSEKRLSSSSTDSHDFKENFPNIEGKELPLDLDAAMEVLVKLHQEVQGAISKLFSFVSATWRKKENMDNKIYDIKTTCHRLRKALSEFLLFVYGALANSNHASDRTLCHKLGKLAKPLHDSNNIVMATVQSLDDKEWHISRVATPEECSTPDELDQLVACARGLVEDVRQVASFIQGNCTLIFKRSQFITVNKLPGTLKTDELPEKLSTLNKQTVQERPLPLPPGSGLQDGKDFANDYDYVNLESKETVERENDEIKAALPKHLHKSFENLIKQSQIPVDDNVSNFQVKIPDSVSNLEPNELQILQFYNNQMETHMSYLTNAIDAFMLTIEKNQPPKVFIGHSKFVIISAHKLVYIGDTVSRNIRSADVKNKVAQCSNSLCDSLKTVVASTKKATLEFPSVAAVQEMVDSVVDVSHLARDLKLSLAILAKI